MKEEDLQLGEQVFFRPTPEHIVPAMVISVLKGRVVLMAPPGIMAIRTVDEIWATPDEAPRIIITTGPIPPVAPPRDRLS